MSSRHQSVHQHQLVHKLVTGLAKKVGEMAHTSVANLDGRNILSDFDSTANNFVTNTQRQRNLSPTASDGVQIRSANTACINGDINVSALERLKLEL